MMEMPRCESGALIWTWKAASRLRLEAYEAQVTRRQF